MTTQAPIQFAQIRAERPDLDALGAQYQDIGRRFESAQSASEREALVLRWDQLRRRTMTWINLTNLHYQQDSTNPQYVAEREHVDRIGPKLTALDIEMKKRLGGSHRAELEKTFGAHLFASWDIEIAAFDPAIESELVEEAGLCSEYTALIASAAVPFKGEVRNLAALDPFMRGADRTERHDAQSARWNFYAQNADRLDRIFDDLVRVRDRMAKKLGFKNYIELGYKRMRRFDYDAQDVARYRDEVVEQIVPLAQAVVRGRAERLGLPVATYWDESLHDSAGNPKPQGDLPHIVAQGAATFHALHPDLGNFYDLMVGNELLDLENRPGKAGGGFCTNFPTAGVPYIFANFNGTEHDVVVLLHEMGHAFQSYSSRHVPLIDSLWPTYETAEVHSMSMEFLSFGEMERFFGPDAARFREHHLAEALLFIPYGVAIDHFQHLVYERPEATPQERHAMWQQVERRYLPWRQYGDLAFPAMGGLWQEKRHIYILPFYYIDYTLAQCCALQFWVRSKIDFAGALSDYIALCAEGGTAPFATLIRGANLRSPFEPGALAGVAQQAKTELGLTVTV